MMQHDNVSAAGDLRERGLTLVELLVAVVMGLVLLAGVATVFLANKETYRVQEALARIQENGRFALGLLGQDLRNAGHFGCASLKAKGEPKNLVEALYSPNVEFADFTRPIDAFDCTLGSTCDSPGLGTLFSGVEAPTLSTDDIPSDILLLRVPDGTESRVSGQSGTALELRDETDVRNGDVALISDCDAAAIFEAKSDPSGSPPSVSIGSQDLGKLFPSVGTMAELQKIRSTAYFVSDTDADGEPVEPTLWRWDRRNPRQALVEGVEGMAVRLGVDTDGDQAADRYLDPDDVDDWNDVVSVRVELVVRSAVPGVANAPQTLNVGGEAWTAPDTRLRQVFTATVGLRNKHS